MAPTSRKEYVEVVGNHEQVAIQKKKQSSWKRRDYGDIDKWTSTLIDQ